VDLIIELRNTHTLRLKLKSMFILLVMLDMILATTSMTKMTLMTVSTKTERRMKL